MNSVGAGLNGSAPFLGCYLKLEHHKQSIEHSKIISAFERNVPDCYVRDYRPNSSWLAVCRGYKTVQDFSLYEKGEPTEITVPRECLCFIPRGTVTATTWWNGMALIRPGWRNQMRLAKKKLTDAQMRRIEKDLKVPVFRDL